MARYVEPQMIQIEKKEKRTSDRFARLAIARVRGISWTDVAARWVDMEASSCNGLYVLYSLQGYTGSCNESSTVKSLHVWGAKFMRSPDIFATNNFGQVSSWI